MKNYFKKWGTYFSIRKNDYWDSLITCRLYIILFFLILPVIYFIIQLNYVSPVGILILGLSVWLILKYVIFEPRRVSIRHFKCIIFITFIIFTNFALCLINYIINLNYFYISVVSSLLIGTIIYFIITIKIQPFKSINSWLSLIFRKWANKKGKIVNKMISLKKILILWLCISIIIITIPYPVYNQKYYKYFFNNNPSVHDSFGIWTYGQSFDEDNIGEPEYLHNDTLEILADAGIYFIYGVTQDKIGRDLIKRLNRCKDFSIEVHLSVNPLKPSYTNIWTFESVKSEIKEILNYLRDHQLLGDPITTLDYDMEVIPNKPFPLYGLDLEQINVLNRYYEIQEEFESFNRYIKKNYGLKIRITTDINQAFDARDGDDDLVALNGLMTYDEADMAYMVYRRNDMGQNFILDHCKILHNEDVIILNSWNDITHHCWKSIDCAIKDARLVLGYPGKSLRLEIWELAHFLYSYGENGLIAFIDAIKEDVSEWSDVIVWNIFPYSFFWDTKFMIIIMSDLYGPLFKLVFRIFK